MRHFNYSFQNENKKRGNFAFTGFAGFTIAVENLLLTRRILERVFSLLKVSRCCGVSENEAKEWLKKQALWQIYLPSPRYIPRPHWTVDKPNEIHQADLLFLPHDTVRRKTFKYALVVIDVASRYKDAEPLTSKESSEVAKSFEKIYSRKLKWPERIIIDPGKEFMGRVTSLMKRHNVIIQRSEAGNHRAQAFVERANRTLSERLFSFQYGKEMSSGEARSDDNERSREWVERLPAVLKSMNNEVTRLTGKEPLEVLKSKDISINAPKYNRPVGFDEVRLSPFAKVRFLFAPGEYEGGERRRQLTLFRVLRFLNYPIAKYRLINLLCIIYLADRKDLLFVRSFR